MECVWPANCDLVCKNKKNSLNNEVRHERKYQWAMSFVGSFLQGADVKLESDSDGSGGLESAPDDWLYKEHLFLLKGLSVFAAQYIVVKMSFFSLCY